MRSRTGRKRASQAIPLIVALLLLLAPGNGVAAVVSDTVTIRGRAMKLNVSGVRTGRPIIVSSGDGGWIHLAPHVADVLAAKGFFVVGFDTRAYLEAFTTRAGTLSENDVQADYGVLADYAAHETHQRPILVGVSEGAGLSVLAASGAHTRSQIGGVLALGLPNINELAWRWKDAVIYLTHGVPKEPTFQVDQFVSRLTPLPFGAIHSSNDEFAPVAEIERIVGLAGQPRKLWTVTASDHRFSDNLGAFDQRLLEAVAWATTNASH